MAVASPLTIVTVSIVMEIWMDIDEDIVLAMASSQTIATVKRSMIDEMNFV